MPEINISLFSQSLHLLDRNVFDRLVKKHKTDKHHKGLNSWTHLVSMLFCYLSKSTSVGENNTALGKDAGVANTRIG